MVKTIFLSALAVSSIVFLLIRRYKIKRRKKELIRKIYAISEKRQWQHVGVINEIFEDSKNFTEEGLKKLDRIKKEMLAFRSEMAKELNNYRNAVKDVNTELRQEKLFDPLDKVGLADKMYTLQGKILQLEVRIVVDQYKRAGVSVGLSNLIPSVQKDPIFIQKLRTAINDDLVFLERRKISDIPFSETEDYRYRYICLIVNSIPIPSIKEDFSARLETLK